MTGASSGSYFGSACASTSPAAARAPDALPVQRSSRASFHRGRPCRAEPLLSIAAVPPPDVPPEKPRKKASCHPDSARRPRREHPGAGSRPLRAPVAMQQRAV
eukprot:gnl/TRDRNA2_/TRDRNA2_164662_c0_seq1.p2 gnl/TRDRNA2_/TRDRNA2_164662_c0~~gnl/TRDRNA2_/TRDRNA2_164662_c0_seq1.p2  ORF type:complete len:103 (+),score=11.74 gnl/TRDRNA2_/TRDRNA2_164662_c0_seq1:2-310(+)